MAEQLTEFLVNKESLDDTLIKHTAVPERLAESEVLLHISDFAFTANNISYAATGKALRYWDFFPTDEGFGLIPVWGFADVIESEHSDFDVGERIYGYFPMASHLIVTPGNVNTNSFIDIAPHRRELSVIYNQYLRCAADPLYEATTEALQMLLRPLFTTSFLLDCFFADQAFFGARTIVLTSASSKTALGMAYLLQKNRNSRDQDYEIVGLTSTGNMAFVTDTAYYDRVINYEDIESLDSAIPAAVIDFAGNADVLARVHSHFADQLLYSCLVGASHWDKGGKPKQPLPGAKPEFFFAPSHAQRCVEDWGPQAFQQMLSTQWHAFIAEVAKWMQIQNGSGEEHVKQVYDEVLAGVLSPKQGHILSL